VLLSRLRIRGKLTLLVMIPLLAMVGLVVPVIRDLVDNAGKATDVDSVATVAGRVGSLLQDLQRERLLSVGYLLGAVDEDDLVLQISQVTDRIRDIRQDLGSDLPAAVRAEIDNAEKLKTLRQQVRARSVTPKGVLDQFAPVLDDMIESLRLSQKADATTDTGRQLIALDSLLRLDESNTESTALLAMMAAGDVAAQADRYRDEAVEYETYLDRFTGFATPPEQELYALVATAFQDRVGSGFTEKFEADPVKTMAALPLAKLFPALLSFSVLGGFVEKGLVDDVTSTVAQQRREQLTIAYGVGSLALLVLLAVLILVAAVGRAVAVPLTRLSRSAEQVAEAGEAELRRVADDDSETDDPVRLEVLEMNSNDEIGDLARAFERVQNTASQLVERQVLSRRNVAEMFGHIGRRTQNLVGGQVTLIDELETEEADPERLSKLYRLDHIANRLRRSADSLVVISGADREESHDSPVRLVDVARLALAEIEEYTRVDLDIPLELSVSPALVSDMVLICAELLENATTFSPPHTRVTVRARAMLDGVQLVIVDHGIGMPDERLVEENSRIARRERLDLVPTQVLGLFVVGRLARRHGLAIALQHTPEGGVTVVVTLSGAMLPGQRVASVEPVVPVTPIVPAPEPARHPVELRPQSMSVISRVTVAMRDPLTWNGFEPVRRLPAPPPQPEVPSLHRRVPGAQLPVETAAPVARPAVDLDPEQARNLVEQFESGVARALQPHDASRAERP
jgi:signal transduction histidine kinase